MKTIHTNNFPSGQTSRTIYRQMLFFIILFILFAASYYDVLVWMYERYISADSYYSHGFIVPVVSAYFIWQKRDIIRNIPAKYSYLGFGLILFSTFLHVVGTMLYIFSVSGFSIFFLIIGISLFLFGWDITKVILFPLLFLVFMFPIPLALINIISFPMKMLVAFAGVGIVKVVGIPVFREGFEISIPAGNLVVGNPCSGLRSLISFMALSSVFANISDISNTKKALLFVLSVPIAILSNIVRVTILILISYFWGLQSAAPDSFWHDASGVMVFVVGFFLLYSFERYFTCKN